MKKKNKIVVVLGLVALVFALAPVWSGQRVGGAVAWAEEFKADGSTGEHFVGDEDKADKAPDDVTLDNPLKTDSILEIIARISRAMLGIIGILAFVAFIFSGLILIISRGNEDKIKKARETMLWAVIGLVVALGSYVILRNIFDILT